MYSHGDYLKDMHDPAAVKDWVQRVKALPEGFRAFKINIDQAFKVASLSIQACSPRNEQVLSRLLATSRKLPAMTLILRSRATANSTPREIAIAKTIEPLNLLFLEDAAERPVFGSMGCLETRLTRTDHDWREARMVRGFKPFLDTASRGHHPPGCIVCGRTHG